MYINFSDLPAHQNIFLDYLHEYDNVAKFYGKNFRDIDKYSQLFKNLSGKERPHLELLTKIIKEQYRNVNVSKQTQQNLNLLPYGNTIVVATGQQLGLFGGPLYTFFKIITAIKLCDHLKEKHDAYNFVPVFWLEGDDHDYDEVRHLFMLNNENQLVNLKYDDGQIDEVNRGSIGQLAFNQNIENVLNELDASLRPTEFKAQIIEFIRSVYKPEKTFLDTFRQVLFNFFDEYGLILFSPVDPAVKSILKPVFEKEITEYQEHTSYLVERSAELEDVYHAQVKVKPINLFYIEEKERLSLEPTDNNEEYRLKGKRRKFTREEILKQLDETPEKFSPNVLLRPICQDYLFPTAFYVAGPGEVSYFAQVSPLYRLFGIEEPFIYPRSSATIVEKGVKSVLDKNNISYVDIFSEEEELIQKIVAASSDINLDELFGATLNEIQELFASIDQKLVRIDKTLNDISSKTKQRIEESLNLLKNKAMDAEKRKYDSTIRQISKVRNVLYPNSNLQERELNWIYFANKYGMDVVRYIFKELTINKFEHQIIEL